MKSMSGDQIGTIVGVAFGCAWGIAGSLPLPAVWRIAGILGSIAASAILILLVRSAPASTGGHFNGAIYGIAVTAEFVAIAIAGVVLNRMKKSSFIPPAVASIVGLHFIGLWLATGNTRFLWLAGILCAIGLGAATMGKAARLPVAGIGSALALWAAALSTLVNV